MDNKKPSERISTWSFFDHFQQKDIPVPSHEDIRREIDALHDEVEKLRSDHDLLFKFHHTHDALNKAVVPNQEKSCEQ
jgi:hypothetical protein